MSAAAVTFSAMTLNSSPSAAGVNDPGPEPGLTGRGPVSKVPEITAFFWIVKALTTAMGESTSDYLVNRFPPVAAVIGGFVAFSIALLIQFKVRRYIAWSYWFAVSMVGVFGTMAADVLHVRLGVPYAASAALFAVVLVAVFVTWYASEKTLSIHSIYTPRRELFYWAAVVSTFALGTAVGDLSASTLKLGYFKSALVFAALMLIPALGYRLFRLNSVLAFWVAYVLTRPLGASVADWLGKPRDIGGLDVGAGRVSVILAILIVFFVAYLAVSKVDTPRHQPKRRRPSRPYY
jgi:uncharacterized membrane-anchored protein